MTKKIIFKYSPSHNESDAVIEEMEFDDNATYEEITDEYVQFMIDQIQDYCTWYEKDKDEE